MGGEESLRCDTDASLQISEHESTEETKKFSNKKMKKICSRCPLLVHVMNETKQKIIINGQIIL